MKVHLRKNIDDSEDRSDSSTMFKDICELKEVTPIPVKKNRVIGTPDYIPPEVLNGVSINNPSIDWWSLGVMVYEFITGIP